MFKIKNKEMSYVNQAIFKVLGKFPFFIVLQSLALNKKTTDFEAVCRSIVKWREQVWGLGTTYDDLKIKLN